jgi:hypothetical protein
VGCFGPWRFVGGVRPAITAEKTNSGENPVYQLLADFAAASDAGGTLPSCAGTQSGSCCYIPPAAASGAVRDVPT